MFRHEGIDVDQVSEAVARVLRDASDDHAAITVSDEHDILKIVALQQLDDVANVRVERHVLRERPGVRSKACQSGNQDRTSALLQPRRDQVPRGRALKGAVNKHDR